VNNSYCDITGWPRKTSPVQTIVTQKPMMGFFLMLYRLEPLEFIFFSATGLTLYRRRRRSAAARILRSRCHDVCFVGMYVKIAVTRFIFCFRDFTRLNWFQRRCSIVTERSAIAYLKLLHPAVRLCFRLRYFVSLFVTTQKLPNRFSQNFMETRHTEHRRNRYILVVIRTTLR